MNNVGTERENNAEEKQNPSATMPPKPPQEQAFVQPPRYPQPPLYPVPPVQQPKGRRVGTVTMACALIAVGVLLIVGTFNQSISFLLMAKLAPIILIVLGIEILFRYFVSKGEKLHYDFLSGFVCFVLIIGSLGMAAIPEVWNNWGPHREILEETLRSEANQICVKALQDEKNVTSMDLSVYLRRSDLPEEMTLKDLRPADGAQIDLKLSNDFTSEEEFVQSVQPILQKLVGTGIPFDYIQLEAPPVEQRYGYILSLDDGLGYNLSNEQLLSNVSTYYVGEEDDFEDYGDIETFAESYMEEFHRFVELYAATMPDAYPARCRAFANHYAEQFAAFMRGEEVVFPSEGNVAEIAPELSQEDETAESTSVE